MIKKGKTIYLCDNCGNEFSSWSGRCQICGEWNTLKEMVIEENLANKKNRSGSKMEMVPISSLKIEKNFRFNIGINEFDRVTGGGIVPGSVILLGGEPGIGKSTLLLEVSNKIKNTIYISAEESLSQIKMRAERIGLKSDLRLVSGGDLEEIEREILRAKPDLLIIDSIQTVFLSSLGSMPGSLVQVRECGIFLQQLAKNSGIPIIIVGHVTKEGNLAGPRMLEHLVDTVLYLEGERFHDARILRAVKNRFGSINEVGIFTIEEKGLIEVKNPSELFLKERQSNPGSVVMVAMEGTRPILIEVQALVVPTHFGFPKRTSSGFDLNRLNLLAAVVSKKTYFNLGNFDIFINVIGGMKLSEPAADLAVCAAIMSSYKNKPINQNVCLFGEVGLGGEIRQVARSEARQKEAIALGFKVIPKLKDLNELIKLLDL